MASRISHSARRLIMHMKSTSKVFLLRGKANKNCMLVKDLPGDLIIDILALAAGTSHTNLFNLKLSCKVFKELAEEGHVYKHVSLENLPIIPWKHELEASLFFDRCIDNGNPEALYRQGVVELFSRKRREKGLQHLRDAMEAGHLGASYLHSMISMMTGKEELVKQGFQLLTRLCAIQKARECREKLDLATNHIWFNYNWSDTMTDLPKLCAEQHWKRIGWSKEYEYFEDESCEACRCDAEISMFFDRFVRNN
ncbi:hypothetical protein CDL15_Pgr021859 [Punica granatum]|nr:hypothetical protein CDL15_Pgr021859 [Punica granatum]PKI54514.1 hypothetical protein CRG98_025028 [Punica granatum]